MKHQPQQQTPELQPPSSSVALVIIWCQQQGAINHTSVTGITDTYSELRSEHKHHILLVLIQHSHHEKLILRNLFKNQMKNIQNFLKNHIWGLLVHAWVHCSTLLITEPNLNRPFIAHKHRIQQLGPSRIVPAVCSIYTQSKIKTHLRSNGWTWTTPWAAGG